MDFRAGTPNIFIVPPILCLVVGLTLAVISLTRGKLKKENILFSMLCVWWCMLSPIFISHHLVSDINVIMRIERSFHAVYVFIIPITFIFFHTLLGLKRRWLEIAMLVFSAVIAALTQTDYYIYGLYTYHWGFMAKGGVALRIFGTASFLSLVYGLVMYLHRIGKETNPIMKMKLRYLLFSILLSALLTLINIPAMSGIDIYPMGNFIFVPLSIMAYGVLRYQLLDIRSILHITLIWIATSSAILIPNALIFALLLPHMRAMGPASLFALLTLWFAANFIYFRRIQPIINRFFNRHHFNLARNERLFIENIAFLKSLDQWVNEFESVLVKMLGVRFATVYLKAEDGNEYYTIRGEKKAVDPVMEEWFAGANHLVEKDMVDTNPYYSLVRDVFLRAFDEFGCFWIVPLMQEHGLIGIVVLGEKTNLGRITANEVRFINNIRSAATIALSNSIMYQRLNDLKNNLEKIVEDRTREIQNKNRQMTFELKIAKDVQKHILWPPLPDTRHVRVTGRMKPLMEVSGDFFDVVLLGEDRIAFAIVDVSGHGVPSALLTSMIKTELETQVKAPGRKTSDICAAMNANLTPSLVETGIYFTMFLCIADLRYGAMEFTSCGHVTPFIISADGEAEILRMEGFMIGVSADSSYESRTVRIKKGDRLFLFTDGIPDIRSRDGEFFGMNRLIEESRDSMRLDPGAQIEALFRRAAEFGQGAPGGDRDDMTVLIAEIGEPVP